jgi:hypothetical protein
MSLNSITQSASKTDEEVLKLGRQLADRQAASTVPIKLQEDCSVDHPAIITT